MKLKICGMKLNMAEVGQLQPDYLGFIFYKKSARYCEEQENFQKELKALPENIKKVGVFVDAEISDILTKIDQFKLNIIQLHGRESVEFCKKLKTEITSENCEIWKVFGIKDQFNFSILEGYESVVDKFLFDTKGKEKGGNGYTFDWSVLKEYPSTKPFILSGGIGPEELDKLKELSKTNLPLYGIDVNSKFETEPGLKDINLLKKFNADLKAFV